MNVRKALMVCAVLLLTASASHAAYSVVTADGTVSWAGGQVVVQPQGSHQYEWLSGDDASSGNYYVHAGASAIAAEDTTATDTAYAQRRWFINVAEAGDGLPVFTANFNITRDLFTEFAGDSAAYDVTMTLKFERSFNGALQTESATSSIVLTDGDFLDDAITAALPSITIDTWPGNEGWLYLRVDVATTAYTAVVVVEEPDEPDEPGEPPVTIPAPGAILLSSLGAGLVGWLRKRKTL